MDQYSEAILPILREARKVALGSFGKIEHVRKKSSSPADVVTDLDLKIESFTANELGKLFPSIGFVGEEYGGNRDQERFFIMDPVDGTSHLIRGTPFCSTMLALVEKGTVMWSAIVMIASGDEYVARRGAGATLNGERIHVSERSMKDSYVFYETRIDKEENFKKYLALRKETIVADTMSAGYEFALVAQGAFDGRITFDPYGKDYDFAPGSLLVEEAGGVVRNIGSTSYNYRNRDFIASNPQVFRALTEGKGALFPNA